MRSAVESCRMTARIAAPAVLVWPMITPTSLPTAWREKNSGSAFMMVSSVCIRMRIAMRLETTAEYHVLK